MKEIKPQNSLKAEPVKTEGPRSLPDIENKFCSTFTSKLEINKDYYIPRFIEKNITDLKPLSEKDQSSVKLNLDEVYTPFNKFANNSTFLIIGLIIGAVINCIILGLASGLCLYGGKPQSIIIIIVSVFSICFNVFGIIIIKKNKRKVYEITKNKDDPERIMQSRERMYLYLLCYFLELTALLYIIVGAGLLKYQGNIKMDIRSRGYDQSKWIDTFGSSSFTDVINHIARIIKSLSSICLISGLFNVALLFYILYLVHSFRTWKIIIQLNCVIFFQANCIFIYFASFCVKYNKIVVSEDAPTWFSLGVLVLGVLGIFIGLIGWFINLVENRKFLLAYIVTVLLLSGLYIAFNIGGSMIIRKSLHYMEAKCNRLFEYVDEDFLTEYVKCKSKYLFTDAELSNSIICPKDRIMIAWENSYNNKTDLRNEYSNHVYGCINQECCLLSYSLFQNLFGYTVLCSFFMMFYCWVMAIGAAYINFNVDKNFEEGIKNKLIMIVILCISAGILIVSIVFIALIPRKSKVSDLAGLYVDTKDNNNNQTILPSNKFIALSNEEIIQLNDKNFQKNLESTVLNKRYYISGENRLLDENDNDNDNDNNNDEEEGEVSFIYTFKTTSGVIKEKKRERGFVVVGTNSSKNSQVFEESTLTINSTEVISDIFSYIELTPICPMLPVNFTFSIDVTKTRKNSEGRRNRRLDDKETPSSSTNNTYLKLDLSSLKMDERRNLLTETIDASIIDWNHSLTFSGNILEPERKAIVEVYSDCYSNKTLFSAKTDSNGHFQIDNIYPLKSGIPFEYNVSIYREEDKEKKNKFYYSFKIGGFGFGYVIQKLINVTIPTELEQSKEVSELKGRIKDSSTNEDLSKAEVYLFKGFKFIKQSDSIDTISNSFDAMTSTNYDGNFVINNLTYGQYTILFKKEEYYSETQTFTISDTNGSSNSIVLDTVALTQKNVLGEISVTLSWPNGPRDLDLHCKFEYNSEDDLYCDVFFAKKECAKVKYYEDNYYGGKEGVEMVKIKELGDYYYLFYAQKYIDISDGVPLGEKSIYNKTEKPGITSSYLESIPDSIISESEATMTVYTPGYSISTISIGVPSSKDAKNENQGDNYWIGFCLNGKEGLSSLKVVNQVQSTEPSYKLCEELYEKEQK